jgi:O-antigen ligase
MPPILAFFLCSAFVLFLLRLDHRKAPGVSRALWIPTVWMMLCSSKPVDVWLGGQGGDVAEGSSMDRNILIGFMVAGLAILFRRRCNWGGLLRSNRWLFALFIFLLISIAWSDFPFVSLKRYVRLWGMILMALVVATEEDPRTAFESLIRRTIFFLIPFSILLIKYYPDYGVEYEPWTGERMWVGMTTQKNGLGRLCLISGFFLFWTLLRRWKYKERPLKYENPITIVFVLMVAWLFRGPGNAYSATSILCMILGVSTLCYLARRQSRGLPPRLKIFAGMTGCIILYGILVPFIGAVGMSAVTSSLGRDTSFTGRTDIWKEVMVFAKENPVLGVGYGAFWVNKRIHIDVSEAHNGYLDVAVEVGYLGVMLVAIVSFAFLSMARRMLTLDFDFGCFGIGFMLILLLHNVTETSFLRASQMWSTFILIQICFSMMLVRAIETETGLESASPLEAGTVPNFMAHETFE